jgi:hypothetical protein
LYLHDVRPRPLGEDDPAIRRILKKETCSEESKNNEKKNAREGPLAGVALCDDMIFPPFPPKNKISETPR